jgi:Ca-activated chloride channel family protein
MGRNMKIRSLRVQLGFVGITALISVAIFATSPDGFSLRTPDQRAYRSYVDKKYQTASELFTIPIWKGVALFEAKDFKGAEAVFAGMDTADAAFNHGNALLLQGKYEAATLRYTRALELRPNWEAATINLKIAEARAALLKKEGGDMTGGMMAPDEIVFETGESPPSTGEEVTEDGGELSEAKMRSIWLRQVQTKQWRHESRRTRSLSEKLPPINRVF